MFFFFSLIDYIIHFFVKNIKEENKINLKETEMNKKFHNPDLYIFHYPFLIMKFTYAMRDHLFSDS